MKELALRPLNDRQADFARLFVSCGNATQAAVAAGFTPATAKNAGTRMLEHPGIALAIAQAARLRLAQNVPVALATLEHLVAKANSERVRLEACRTLLGMAGIVAPAPAKLESNGPEKALHEYSIEELRTLAAKWENEIANRAKPINPPASDPDDELIG